MPEWPYWEEQFLAPWAAHSSRSLGREHPEEECPLRTVWQRDRDRIIHSKAFRRLKHKTQVFVNPQGDHFRTRLTHTLEVMQIARTVARALRLNEDLTEAIALGHDLGHTPFGHAGERALASLNPEFSHNSQGVRIVRFLERDGQGLNLTGEVIDGILCHSGAQLPQALEGSIIRLADRIAYLNHDIDDAVRSGLLAPGEIPPRIVSALGATSSRRINAMVADIVRESAGQPRVAMGAECASLMEELREFMFSRVYFHPRKVAEEQKLEQYVVRLYGHFMAHPEELPGADGSAQLKTAVCDYLSGMTDTFALEYTISEN